jgi:hypothetical protein
MNESQNTRSAGTSKSPSAGARPSRRHAGPLGGLTRRLQFYRTLHSIADNRTVRPWTAVSPTATELHRRIGFNRERIADRQRARFEDDLRLINDVLADSPLAGRYWVWSGLLLGWAREGRVLPHDIGDADFGYDAADDRLLDQVEPILAAAGFTRWYFFRNSAGELTERVFVRHGFKFEFFRMADVGDGNYQFYGYHLYDDHPLEIMGRTSRQEVEPFSFLDRHWLKPRDHDLSLRTNYGDWRTPDPGWDALAGPAVLARRPWRPGSPSSAPGPR